MLRKLAFIFTMCFFYIHSVFLLRMHVVLDTLCVDVIQKNGVYNLQNNTVLCAFKKQGSLPFINSSPTKGSIYLVEDEWTDEFLYVPFSVRFC